MTAASTVETKTSVAKGIGSKAATVPADRDPFPPWSVRKLFGFRLAVCFFALSTAAVGVISYRIFWSATEQIRTAIGNAAATVGAPIWGGRSTIALSVAQVIVHYTGLLLIALSLAFIWTALDRRRTQYSKLEDALRTCLRYLLAGAMLDYGIMKVIPVQFSSPSLDKLVTPLGQLRPNGVLWSYMGLSPVYEIFTGLGEAVGGFLLLFRRTTTVGLLLLMAVLSNVVIINFAYNLGPKMAAAQLFVMACYLLLPDLTGLFGLFIRHEPTGLPVRTMTWWPWQRPEPRFVLKVVVIGWMLFVATRRAYHGYTTDVSAAAPKHNLYGIYDVEMFARNGDTLPPLLTDKTRWRRIVSGSEGEFAVQTMQDKFLRYDLVDDSLHHTLQLTESGDSTKHATGGYDRESPTLLRVHLVMGPESLSVRARRIDTRTLPVFSTPFGWKPRPRP